MKVFLSAILITFCVALVTAQSRYRSTKSRNRNEPAAQGRTLGLLRPLFGFTSLLGYDQPIASYNPVRRRPANTAAQSDSYYDGYGGYNYPPNGYYGPPIYGYNPYYGGYPGYGPPIYPGNFGGYPYYPDQRPNYGGNRPSYQRPNSRPIAATVTPTGSTSSSGAGATSPASIGPEQAAQVANLLGQLLGSQLRPLINGASADPIPDTTPSTRRLVG